MEDVKDTLWKWFVQLSAVLGLCCSIYVAYSCASLLVSLPRTPPRETPDFPPELLRAIRTGLLSGGLLLGPMLGAVWFRMMLMRKWAAWVICVLGAWAILVSMSLLPRTAVVSLLADRLGSGADGSLMWRAIATSYIVLLGCALMFRPKIWRDSV